MLVAAHENFINKLVLRGNKLLYVMKKKFILLVCLCVNMIAFAQPQVTARMANGDSFVGIFLLGNDTTITVRVTENIEGVKEKYGTDIVQLKTSDMTFLKINDRRYVRYDNRFVLEKEAEKLEKQRREEEIKQNLKSNNVKLNYAIGHAFKVAGGTSMAVGIPCLTAGLVTLIAGNAMNPTSLDGLWAKSNLIESSYYLFPIGASLTIVGIPLYVQGKKILDMNFVYSNNGLGVSMNF